MSTNKVYGDAPNELPREELPLRFEFALEPTAPASTKPAVSIGACTAYSASANSPAT